MFSDSDREEKRTWPKPTETRNSARVIKNLLALNISSGGLYRHQAKISGHDVCIKRPQQNYVTKGQSNNIF